MLKIITIVSWIALVRYALYEVGQWNMVLGELQILECMTGVEL